MKSLVSLIAIIASATFAVCNDIQPFNQLAKDNVRLDYSAQSSNKINDRWSTDYGSHGQDKTTTKAIIVEATQTASTKIPLKIECFFQFNGDKGKYIWKAGDGTLPTGEGKCQFSQTARNAQSNYVYLGRTSSGEKITGWLARAIAPDNRIVGVIASSSNLLDLAKNPSMLDSELKSN